MFTRPPVVKGRLLAPFIFLSFFSLFGSLFLDIEGWARWPLRIGRCGDVYEATSRKGERESGCLGDCGHISPISHTPPHFEILQLLFRILLFHFKFSVSYHLYRTHPHILQLLYFSFYISLFHFKFSVSYHLYRTHPHILQL